MSSDLEKDLKSSKGDILHSAINAGLGSIPVAGGFVSELFSVVITSPIEKRKEEWMIRIYNSLTELENKVDSFKIEELSNNEEFISVLSKASHLALHNHQYEKLQALHNAVINTALKVSIDENEKMMFLNMIDVFTPIHLKLIFFFDNPKLRLEEKNITTNYSMGSPYEPLFSYYPEFKEQKDFIALLIKDLYKNGVMSTESLSTMMTADGMVSGRLTGYGDRFYKYIKNFDVL